MGFVGVYRAIYDYTPSGAGEIALAEGDLLYVLEKSTDDDWWKAKKKAEDDADDEPEGLIPNNYVEEVESIGSAKALYDYSRQTDEELSFSEDAVLHVYDNSDEDWILVGLDGEYGFVPANYIEVTTNGAVAPAKPPRPTQQPTPQTEPEDEDDEMAPGLPARSPAAAIANVIQQKTGGAAPVSASRPAQQQLTPEESDEEPAPQLPRRPPSQPTVPTPSYAETSTVTAGGVMATPEYGNRDRALSAGGTTQHRSGGGYHLYNIHEMISHMGKNKKMPTTLGINCATGIIMIAPEKSKDGSQKEWTAEKLTHYSIEGKHVFIELVKPSRSIDFHAGAKDTAQEIVTHLGELAGASRAGGMSEVFIASKGSGQKRGEMSFEFMAQGDDEVTVAAGDEVIILDDTASDEWWQVRRLKNGNEGVVPASFVKVVGGSSSAVAAPTATSSIPPIPSASTVERNRREEERLTREAARSSHQEDSPVPNRYSSLTGADVAHKTTKSRSQRSSSKSISESAPKPNLSRVREWTDRTGSFKVDAEFLGLKDNKIHLHKQNGVKIAVPVSKMSIGDLEYVERATGKSLEDEKPLSEIKRKSTIKTDDRNKSRSSRSAVGASVEAQGPKYDWFDFFLQCGVNPQICEKYTNSFEKDQMGEENLADIQPALLRTLGLKEGDILRVMKFLDSKFSRSKEVADTPASEGGLFSGPDGVLKGRKGRPSPAVAASDVVDAKAFEKEARRESATASPVSPTKPTAASRTAASGFDDDAWDLKPSRNESVVTSTPTRVVSPTAPVPQKPISTGDLAGLSLMDEPLVPTKAPQAVPTPAVTAPQPQSNGADRTFFDQLARPSSQGGNSGGRQRPHAPLNPQATGLIAPPPQRPMSAPQNQQSAFAPPPQMLQPQLTGYQPLPNLAPPGQSLSELNQQRMMPQMTGYMQQGYAFHNGMMPQPTGYQPPMQTGYPQFPQQQQQPGYMNPQYTASPFADPPRAPFQPQPTGYQPMMPQATGVNAFLPPALTPQRTGPSPNGFMSQPTGYGSMQPIAQQMSPPPVPQQHTPAPLVAQKTGPTPPVRFGVQPSAKPLIAQPTGRANLAKATPDNPFGF